MGSDDVTLGVLIDIRDAVRSTNERVDKLTERVDRLEGGLVEVRKTLVASETRTTTAIHELTDTTREVLTLLRDRLELRDRVERCEHDIETIKRKIG